MEFYEIMINLCIGIVGGIFSSIIVSRIFLIQSSHSEQISRVQEHFEYLYGLDGLVFFYPHISKEYNGNIDTLNKHLLDEIIRNSKQECEKFRYMIFDDLEKDLHEIAVDLSDLMEELKSLKDLDNNVILSIHNKISDLENRFNAYKKSSNGYFKQMIINDKILRILLIIFIVIIVVTINV